MSTKEEVLAREMWRIARQLAGSESVLAKRAGERVSTIIGDLLYEFDPLARLPDAEERTESKRPAEEPAYSKPLPVLNDENRGHWDAAKKLELRLQRCLDCSFIRYPIATVCPRCLSTRCEWALLSGRGVVSSWVVFHKAYWQGFKSELPYIVAQIELEEGPRYTSNLVRVHADDVRIGMPVEVEFEAATPEVTLPKFRPR